MAFVPVPKDLNRVKTKVMFNLTKRQLICFALAAAVGVPIFFLTKTSLGLSTSAMLMVVFMLPFIFFALYEKDGQPAEKILGHVIKSMFLRDKVRPYFREKEVTLKNLTAKDIQEFYLRELERVSASSVIHYHANIHKALKYAVKIDLIDVNPADKVERPKKDRFVGSFYDADEVNALFEAAKGSKLELPILFGAFYGLRRSEAIGLKWDAIDFDQNTITIRHTVTSCDLDGKRILVAADTTKTKSSMRTLPLVPFMRERLLALKEEQEDNRRLCGRSYIKDYIGYVCVNEIGDLIKPHYVTESFPKLLKANGLRHIRYHDLRHSCASLLLANGVPMKQIQEWLGHSDFSTTANIYAHLDYSSKLTSADAMLNGLGLVPN